MAIVPRKKISKHKKRVRHSARQTINIKRLLNLTNVVVCKNCGSNKQNHRVCEVCGYYKNKQVLTIKTRGPKTIEA